MASCYFSHGTMEGLLASLIVHCFKPLCMNPVNPFTLSPDSGVKHICVHKQKQTIAMFTI